MPTLRRSKRSVEASTSGDSDTPQECAACGKEELDSEGEEAHWVACGECEAWYHWECVRPSPEDALDSLEKWYCESCIAASQDSEAPLEIVYKARKSARTTSKHNYANLQLGENDPERWIRIAESKPMQPNNFKRMRGKDLTLEWIMSDPDALLEPIIIESPEGLDMKMPRNTMTVADVAKVVGEAVGVEVMDVASQNGLDNWTLGRWAQYFHDPNRSKIRNVISLEVSDTKLSPKVIPPKIVRQIDWIETIWPKRLKEQGVYPKVQKYCLMSVAKCWTDWVSRNASSVYYHILSGGKTFFFIRPTADNLRKYELWSGSHLKQEQEWLGDSVDAVYRVDLEQGNTMIIPSGWIHSVYTPSDALVFGGNFLHSLNIGTQLRIFEIEKKTKVPMKYRFPYFVTFLWYVCKHYSQRLRVALAEQTTIYEREKAAQEAELAAKRAASGMAMPLDFSDEKGILPIQKVKLSSIDSELTQRVLVGLKKLTIFLLEQGDRFLPDSRASADEKRWARDNLPEDVAEPYDLAVAFRAQVLAALDEKEDTPALLQPAPMPTPIISAPAPSIPQKRKAPAAAPGAPKFKNFALDPNKAQKLDAGGVVTEQTEKDEPVSRVEKLPRKRPAPSGFDDGDGDPEWSDVKTTSTETRVTRLTRYPDGRVVREVRHVRTIVERTAWEPNASSAVNHPGLHQTNGHRSPAPSPNPVAAAVNGHRNVLSASTPASFAANGARSINSRPPLPYMAETKPAEQPYLLQQLSTSTAPRMPHRPMPAPNPTPQYHAPPARYPASYGISDPAMYSTNAAAYTTMPDFAPRANGGTMDVAQSEAYRIMKEKEAVQRIAWEAQQAQRSRGYGIAQMPAAPAAPYGIAAQPNGGS